jgi:ribosome maturation factor RimP
MITQGGFSVPKERVTDIVEKLALPIANEVGVELVDIEYKKEGSSWFLRVFIDKPEGVDIDDCSRVSEKLSDQLDIVDPIQNAYFLEVSSPGAERPLKKPADFQKAIGKPVYISLYEPVDGLRAIEGLLTNYDESSLEIEYIVKTVKKKMVISTERVAQARLSVQL